MRVDKIPRTTQGSCVNPGCGRTMRRRGLASLRSCNDPIGSSSVSFRIGVRTWQQRKKRTTACPSQAPRATAILFAHFYDERGPAKSTFRSDFFSRRMPSGAGAAVCRQQTQSRSARILVACAMADARFSTPGLVKICSKCLFTVRGLIPRISLISRFDLSCEI
jgi:hypothetical protein